MKTLKGETFRGGMEGVGPVGPDKSKWFFRGRNKAKRGAL